MKKILNFLGRKRKLIIVLVIIIVGAVVWKVKFSKKAGKDTGNDQITTAQVARGDVQTQISGKGTLSPMDQYEVKSLVKGKILQAPFEEDSEIKKGDLLYKISTNEIQGTLDEAEQTVKKAEDSYQDAEDALKDLQLKSNCTGYVKKLSVHKGDTVAAGTEIAEIYDDSYMYLEIAFPKAAISESFVGKTAKVTLEGSSEVIRGTVKKISKLTDSLEGGVLTKDVTIEVKNPGGIKEGSSATAMIADVVGVNIGTFKVKTNKKLNADGAGKIESIDLKEGSYVESGQIYAQLSSKELTKNVKDAKESIVTAKKSLKTQNKQLDEYSIKAPISGRVITRNKKKGDTIDPSVDSSAGPMAIIYDMSALNFQMAVDEMDIAKVKVGQTVSIIAAAYPDQTYEGKVEKISLKGTTENGMTTYPVTVKVKDFGNLLPGMNVTGSIITDEAKGVLTIPSGALQRGNVVYVKKSGADAGKTASSSVETTANSSSSANTASTSSVPEAANAGDAAGAAGENPMEVKIPKGFVAVTVTIGLNDGMNVEIKDGLSEGDTIYVPYNSMGGDMGMDMGDYGGGDGGYSDSGESTSTQEEGAVG